MTTSFVTCQWHYNDARDYIYLLDDRDACLGFVGHSKGTWYFQKGLSVQGRQGSFTSPRKAAEGLLGAIVDDAVYSIPEHWNEPVNLPKYWATAFAESKWPESTPPKPIVTPEQVKAALLKKPRLLWGTLRALASLCSTIAGPWEEKPGKDNSILHFRSHPLTFSAVIRVHVNAQKQVHVWRGNARLQGCEAPTAEESKQKVDEELRSLGWILISEEEDP
jgi:hypothetical protein